MNEQEQFLKDIEPSTEVDVFEQSFSEPEKDTQEVVEDTTTEENKGDEPRNRRERRLMKALEDERASAAFLAGKLEARTEASKALSEETDYIKGLERIYGTDSPEALLATDLLKKAIVGAREDAENRAYDRIRSERQLEAEELTQADKELDSIVEDLEDEYSVTLTAVQERSFMQLLEKMSPKDKNGEVTDYADPHAVWEVFQERLNKKPVDTRAKDLSARSMVNSGASTDSKLLDDAQTRFLKENGII